MARPRLELGDYLTDPLATIARARAEGWLGDLDGGNVVALTHDAVRELLADPRLHANFPDFLRRFGVTAGPFFDWMAQSPLNRDGADHQRWRAVMSRTFTPRRVEGLRPFLHTAAHGLIDGFAARGHCDFVAEFADVYPSLGLCELIGVPLEDRDRFRGWANTIGLGFSPLSVASNLPAIDAALVELLAYTGALAATRRLDPRDDLVSRIARAGDEEGWREEEISGAIAGLVFAGHETTKNQLGWTVAILAGEPAVWDGVAAGDLDAASVIEEVLRYRSAVSGAGRTVAEPVERQGAQLAPGTQVLLSLWGAAHDPAAYPHPDSFDPAQSLATSHLAFGHGAHYCLGAALARAELVEATGALAARITCPTVGDGAVWRPPAGITGPERLPLSFTAR